MSENSKLNIAIVTAVSSVIGAGAGGYLTYLAADAALTGKLAETANQSREIDIKMIDVSLAILRGEKGDKKEDGTDQSINARRFALRALKKYAKLDAAENDTPPRAVNYEEWASIGGRLKLGGWDEIIGKAMGTNLPVWATAEWAARITWTVSPDPECSSGYVAKSSAGQSVCTE